MTTAPPTTPQPAPTPTTAKTLNALLHLPAQMELSQIELIYRAEGNANLVLALPQFKKVLRLPKMISSGSNSGGSADGAGSGSRSRPSVEARPEGQTSVSDPTKASSAKAGVLTMPDFMAYIEIMRRLLGNEFVCAADIVAIPRESDRFWINEHIRVHRPVARLDKEFVGPFGLLLPDVTQLPATFDVLLANLQAKDMNMDTDMDADICSSGSRSECRSESERGSRRSRGITPLGDTYAIEIKPKQGWLQLPSDVSDLFDLMPTGAGTMDATYESNPNPNPNPDLNPNLRLPAEESRRRAAPSMLKPDKCRCRYCSMQVVKLHKGKIKRLGQYCPLELFSGAPGRMFEALTALFACPQNNLRVFHSGNLIYGDHANSISCEELHSRVFPGEIMALIKHLLVACLLRDYSRKEGGPAAARGCRSHVAAAAAAAAVAAAFGESTFKPCCGTKTKETATIEIGVANATARHVERKKDDEPEPKEELVKAVAGQPQRRAAAETASPRYTKRTKLAAVTTQTTTTTTTTTTIGSTCLSANVAMATVRTEMETETETLATATPGAQTKPNWTAPPTLTLTPSPLAHSPPPRMSTNPCETRARLNKAEIFHLPKNCVLQKILHLQLLVKRHFDYMWAQGHAAHATASYEALTALLASGQDNADELAAEQAYMLGATALDCSIMLTFQEIRCADRHNSALQPWLVAVEDRQFLTKLSVLDLDPKPDSHFHKYIKQSREIEKCLRAVN